METSEHYLNDKHSRLNPTSVCRIAAVRTQEEVRREVIAARDAGESLSIGGGRHAMGGQQFADGAVYLDTCGLSRVISLDSERGLCTVEAGIQWPQLMAALTAMQTDSAQPWTFAQKQTGANALTIGGAMAANIHGRGLRMKPLARDIESFTLVDGSGGVKECSRTENSELFRLAIGGYGLFGVVTTVTLRLVRRQKLQRIVEVIHIDGLIAAFEQRIADGFLYGDFQFVTDPQSPDFLRRGVFSCYGPVAPNTPIPDRQKHLSEDDWRNLVYLAHVDKARAFELYADHYLSTTGQIYLSDAHQIAVYLDDYHTELDEKLGAIVPGAEVIGELFVPRSALTEFMHESGPDLRAPTE